MQYPGVHSIVRNASYLLGARSLTIFVRGIYAVILAQQLGPELYGLFNYGLSWYLTFLSLTSLGLGAVVSRAVGNDRRQGRTVAIRSFSLCTLVTLVASVACAGAAWMVEDNMDIRWLLVVFSSALLGRSLAGWVNQIFTAYEAARYAFRLESSFRVCEVSIGVILLHAGGGLLEIVYLHVAVWWAQSISGLLLIHRLLIPIRFDWNGHAFASLLVMGIPIGLGQLLGAWLIQGPVMMFRHFEDTPASLGQFSLAMQALQVVAGVAMAVGAAGLPVISRSIKRTDGKVRVYIEVMLRLSFFFGAIVSLTSLTFGSPLVSLLFGDGYTQTGNLLGIVFWILIPIMWCNSTQQLLIAAHRTRSIVLSAAFGAISMTISFPWLVSSYGASGAAAALAAGMSFQAASLTVFVLQTIRFDLKRAIARPAIAVLIAVCTYFPLVTVNSWLALAGSLLILTYATLKLSVFSHTELSVALSLLQKWSQTPINRLLSRKKPASGQ